MRLFISLISFIVAVFSVQTLLFAEANPSAEKAAVTAPGSTTQTISQPDLSSPGVNALPASGLTPAVFARGAAHYTYQNEPDESLNQELATALAKTAARAAEKAGSLAKTVGLSISEFVKERQALKSRDDLLQKFYRYRNYYLDPLQLDPVHRERVALRVEQIYVEDGTSGKYNLDTQQFLEMPGVIKKAYGETMLAETRDGEVKTYYINGRVETSWTFKGGMLDGPVIHYDENGELVIIDIYKEGRKISRKKYDPEGKLEFEQRYDYEQVDLPRNVNESLNATAQPTDPASASLASPIHVNSPGVSGQQE